MKPINDVVVIRPIVEEVKLDSGMIVSNADMSDVRYLKAEVIAVSSEIPSELVKEGDTVLYDKSNYHQAYLGEEKLTIIKKRDIVIVL